MAGWGHRDVGDCTTMYRLPRARVDHRWVEQGARPKQEERAWESWSLGLVSSSGQFVPSAQGKWNEGGSSQLCHPERPEGRAGGEQGGKAGAGAPRAQQEGEASAEKQRQRRVWAGPRRGPVDSQPNPPSGPPQGPQQTEPCYANLELQTQRLWAKPEWPRQAETEYSTAVSVGAGSRRGDTGPCQVRHLRGWCFGDFVSLQDSTAQKMRQVPILPEHGVIVTGGWEWTGGGGGAIGIASEHGLDSQ